MQLRFELRNTIWLVVAFLAGMTAIAQTAKADKLPDMPEVTGATFKSEKTDVLIYVDAKRAQARDSNTGNANQPVKSFARGIELAKMHLKEGRSVKVLLGAGEYPVTQTVRIIKNELGDKGREALLIIEGAGPDKTIVHGYEDWSDRFEPVEDQGADEQADKRGHLYVAELDEPWGMGPQPWWSRFGVFIGPAGSMPGMIHQGEFVHGVNALMLPLPLDIYEWHDPDGSVRFSHDGNPEDDTPGQWKYVRSRTPDDLATGMFGLLEHGEGKPKLYIRTHEPISQRDPIYVATIQRLLNINEKNNVIIRGINFTGTGHYPVAGVGVMLQCDNLLIENCHFNWHSSRGVSIGNMTENITLRNCQFNYNGWRGLGASKPNNLLIEDCEAIGNNWRGHLGNQHGCDAAGIKIMGPDSEKGVLVRRLYSAFNFAHGLWFDHCNKEYAPVQIEDSYIGWNQYGYQLYIEKQAGPIRIERVSISNIGGNAGIYAVARDVTITDSVITTGPRDGACILIGERGNSAVRRSSDWLIRDTALVAEGSEARLISGLWGRKEMWAEFYKSSQFEFFALATHQDTTFAAPGGNYMSLEDWRGMEQVNENIQPVEAKLRLTNLSTVFRELRNKPGFPKLGNAGPTAPMGLNPRVASLNRATRAHYQHRNTLDTFEVDGDAKFYPVDLEEYLNAMIDDDGDWRDPKGLTLVHRSRDFEGRAPRYAGIPIARHFVNYADKGVEYSVCMRSSRRTEINGRKLPAKVTVDFNRKADAVFILHSAEDYKNTPGKFGTYRMIYADGSKHETPIIAYGQRWPMEDHKTREQATIANKATRWTPLRNENVRPVRIARDEGTEWEWLHLLRIKNPHTDKTIKAIEIETDPNKRQNLTVYAMTAVVAESNRNLNR